MMSINKHDVESILGAVNRNIPRRSQTIKTEFKIDYAAHYGGWMIYYYDGNKIYCPFRNRRISHKEAYRFFEGILFSLEIFKIPQ